MRTLHLLVAALITGTVAIDSACGQSALDRLEKKAKAPLTAVPKAAAPSATAPATGSAAEAAVTSDAPYLGVEADEVTLGIRGALISKVKPGAPSELGGLKDGDIITAIDGKPIRNWNEVDAALKNAQIGAKVSMTIQRGGLQESKTVTLGRKPESKPEDSPAPPAAESTAPAAGAGSPAAPARSPTLSPPGGSPLGSPLGDPAARAPTLTPPGDTPLRNPAADPLARPARDPNLDLPPPPASTPSTLDPLNPAATTEPPAPGDLSPAPAPGAGRATLGISVVPLTPETRIQYNVRATARQGAIIHSVRPGSPADLAGLPMGGVIVSIDGQLVKSSDDLAATVAAARPGQEVELRYMLEGDRVATKTVRLAPAAAAAIVPGPTGSGEGPNLREFENLADPATRPNPTTRADTRMPIGSTIANPSLVKELHDEITLLTSRIESLEKRLNALEGKAGGAEPAP